MFSAEYINQDGWVASYSNSCLCWEWRSRNRCGPQVRMSSNEPSVSPCAWLNWRAPLCARPQFWASCYFYPQLTFSEFKLEYWDTLLRGITTIHCLSWGSCSLFPTVRGTLAILPYPHRVPSVWKGVSWVNRDSSGFVSPCLSFPSLLPLHFFPPSSWDTVSYSGLASNPSHSWGWPWADHLPGLGIAGMPFREWFYEVLGIRLKVSNVHAWKALFPLSSMASLLAVFLGLHSGAGNCMGLERWLGP